MTRIIPPKSTPNGYQPLRNAFEQFGRERFASCWTGHEVMTRSGLQWAQALDAFVQELEAGRIAITNLLSDGKLSEVPTNYWRTWDATERLVAYLTGNDDDADEYYHGSDCPRYVMRMPIVGQSKTKVGRPGPGAPTKFQKEELWNEFDAHCKAVGPPSTSNEKGWHTQADVARWLVDKIEKLEGVTPDHRDGAVRRMAREFIKQWDET